MNRKQQTIRSGHRAGAFTLMELVVAVGIFAIVLSMSGVIFKVTIDAQRTASANAEIMRNFRAITEQLNADFKALRKDGEIFVIWVATPVDDDNNGTVDRYERFDRIMFFANGDFQSYNEWPDNATRKIVRGNTARISYMLANKPPENPADRPIRPNLIKPAERILARTQHILTADPEFDDNFDLTAFPFNETGLYDWQNLKEYDKTTLADWLNIPWIEKAKILSSVCDIIAGGNIFNKAGTTVDLEEPCSIHTLFCEGVGEFMIQGWYDKEKRWLPEVDPDGDGSLKEDSDFFLDGGGNFDPCEVPGIIYPYRKDEIGDEFGGVYLGDDKPGYQAYPPKMVTEANFNKIPGFGRAFKFTFTLYDSKGILKDGRTCTYIVYLDN